MAYKALSEGSDIPYPNVGDGYYSGGSDNQKNNKNIDVFTFNISLLNIISDDNRDEMVSLFIKRDFLSLVWDILVKNGIKLDNFDDNENNPLRHLQKSLLDKIQNIDLYNKKI